MSYKLQNLERLADDLYRLYENPLLRHLIKEAMRDDKEYTSYCSSLDEELRAYLNGDASDKWDDSAEGTDTEHEI
jgi:hypothetical protein